MNYITREGDDVKCTHPLVERVWQVGYDARKYAEDKPDFKTKTIVVMKDGSRKDFVDTHLCFDNAEKYLQELNNN